MRTRDAFNYETISLLKWLYGINIAGEKCLCNEAKNAFWLMWSFPKHDTISETTFQNVVMVRSL